MKYIVNCDKLKFFKTFSSLDSIIEYFEVENKSNFDGQPFSLFGRGMKEVMIPNADNSDYRYEWVDADYYIDSIVLSKEEEYFKFFIRCINSKGDLIELD